MKRFIFTYSLIIISFCLFAQRNERLNSPEILPDNSVIFRMKAPGATDMKVVGTWAVDFTPTTMIKKDSGLFEVKIGPLESNMYEYRLSRMELPFLIQTIML